MITHVRSRLVPSEKPVAVRIQSLESLEGVRSAATSAARRLHLAVADRAERPDEIRQPDPTVPIGIDCLESLHEFLGHGTRDLVRLVRPVKAGASADHRRDEQQRSHGPEAGPGESTRGAGSFAWGWAPGGRTESCSTTCLQHVCKCSMESGCDASRHGDKAVAETRCRRTIARNALQPPDALA